jgi:hypothetical protein
VRLGRAPVDSTASFPMMIRGTAKTLVQGVAGSRSSSYVSISACFACIGSSGLGAGRKTIAGHWINMDAPAISVRGIVGSGWGIPGRANLSRSEGKSIP